MKPLRRGSIKVGRWKAGKHRGTVITMTPAGMRWWLGNAPPAPREIPLMKWLKLKQ